MSSLVGTEGIWMVLPQVMSFRYLIKLKFCEIS